MEEASVQYPRMLTVACLEKPRGEGRGCALEKQGAPLGKLSGGPFWKKRRFEETQDHILAGRLVGEFLLFGGIKFLEFIQTFFAKCEILLKINVSLGPYGSTCF